MKRGHILLGLLLMGVVSGCGKEENTVQQTGSSITTVTPLPPNDSFQTGLVEQPYVLIPEEEEEEEQWETYLLYAEEVEHFFQQLDQYNTEVATAMESYQKKSQDEEVIATLQQEMLRVSDHLLQVQRWVAPWDLRFPQEEFGKSGALLAESYRMVAEFLGMELPSADLLALTQDIVYRTADFNSNGGILLDQMVEFEEEALEAQAEEELLQSGEEFEE